MKTRSITANYCKNRNVFETFIEISNPVEVPVSANLHRNVLYFLSGVLCEQCNLSQGEGRKGQERIKQMNSFTHQDKTY